MSYIGQTLPADTFQGFVTDRFTGDGTANKTFTLSKTPANESAILVTIDGVVQEATDDFTVSGTTLTLVGTAANGSEVNAIHMGGVLPIGQAASLDLNGASDQLILDADADTTISADTDDQIDFKVAGTDQIKLTDGILAPTTTNDVDLGSTSLRFKDVAISNDIVHLDNAGTGRTLYDRSENLLGNTGTNLTAASIYLGGTGSANQLSDYEEGTWTPTFNGTAGGASGVSYSNRLGWYEKVGDMVTVHAWLTSSSMTSVPSGGLTITGLPFTAVNTTNFYHSVLVGYAANFSGTESPQAGYINPNTTYMNIVGNAGSDARSGLNDAITCSNAMSGDEHLMVTATYRSE